jgi:glycosyltransferase involved in cell wall biosynthesis
MRVILDIPRLQLQPHGGLFYVEHLVRALAEAPQSEYQFVLHTNGLRGMDDHRKRLDMLRMNPRLRAHASWLPDTFLRYSISRLHLPDSAYVYGHGADLVHAFGSRYVPLDFKNLVLTLQDVIALKEAKSDSPDWRRLRATLLDLSERAKLIITISEFSKREICDNLDVDPSKIIVIPNGVDTSVFHPIRVDEHRHANEVLTKFGLRKQSYVLFLGGDASRKNLPRLLRSFDLAKQHHHIEDKLVIVGSKSNAVHESVTTLASRDDISFLGYLSQLEVVALLQNSKMLIFPSLYEGFGLPPLEAMASGVPVVVTNSSSVPEVVGDAGIYFNPLDVDEIAEAIARVSEDAKLRSAYIEKGLNRSRMFSWQHAAQSTLRAYEQVLAKNALHVSSGDMRR